MMIDRKVALESAVLVALMLLAAVARIIFVHDSSIPANQEAALLWQTFLLPINPALLVVTLYANGRRAIAAGAGAEVQPSYDWGKRLSIGCCAGTLLIQGQLILQSFGLQVPEFAVMVGYATAVAMSILVLMTINHTPKLPWLEGGSLPGGKLGPIYGPRFIRANAKIWLLCFIIVMPCVLGLPRQAWLYILLAFASAFVWTTALRVHYGRRSKLGQSTAAGVKS
jgi:hypothetical protein